MSKTAQYSMVRVALVMGIAAGACAQTGPVFEVSASTGRQTRISRTPQRIAFGAAQVGDLIAFAWDLPLDRVERRPQWMYDDRYNVAVTTADPAGLPDQKLMLQKLLEERFGLMVHKTSYPSPVYFLVPGAKVNLTKTAESDAVDIPEFQNEPLQPGVLRPSIYATHMSMSDLAAWLYPELQLPVLDKTGITGFFDIELRIPVRAGAEGTIRAVQNDLGLNLEIHAGTAESLIIDRAEKPKI